MQAEEKQAYDDVLAHIKDASKATTKLTRSREVSLVQTKLDEARLWLETLDS